MTPIERELVELCGALIGVCESLNAHAPGTARVATAAVLSMSREQLAEIEARAKSTGTREAIVTDDGHGRAMVEGKRLAWGGAGIRIGDLVGDPADFDMVKVGTRVLVEFRPGTDFATLIRVMP